MKHRIYLLLKEKKIGVTFLLLVSLKIRCEIKYNNLFYVSSFELKLVFYIEFTQKNFKPKKEYTLCS